MERKAIIIDVNKDIKSTGNLNKWDEIGNINEFTDNIITPAIDDNNRDAIVTGMPSIFARSKMFKLAFESVSKKGSPSLMKVYSDLLDEWKGFVACIALNTNLRVNRIYLKYSDGKSFLETANPYEPLGAFGNMLFEERPLWSALKDGNISDVPFIDVVKDNGMVLGGTCPHTLLFTAPSYKVSDSRYSKDGKFSDPIKLGNLTNNDLLKLYAYVKNIKDQFPQYQKSFVVEEISEKLRPNFDNLIAFLNEWFNEIRKKALAFIDNASANDISGFQAPYDQIFNCSDEIWGRNGLLFSERGQGRIVFHTKELLLDDGSEIARFHFDEDIVPSKLPVYLLEARIKSSGNKTYFALPLTSKGLAVFGQNLGSLMDKKDQDVPTYIDAEFDDTCSTLENNLHVTLHLGIDGKKKKSVSGSYRIRKSPIENIDFLLWPNFISTQWTKYFLYSEIPHNREIQSEFHAEPFVGKLFEHDFRPVVSETGDPLCLTCEEKYLEQQGVSSEIVVNANSDVRYHYDIYESNVPFYGIRLTVGGMESGLLIIHYAIDGEESNGNLPLNRLRMEKNFRDEVELGFDFGSTNTSIAYHVTGTSSVQALEFKARRKSLLGLDTVKRKTHPRDVLFFYNPKMENGRSTFVRSNGIKSMMALHDPRLLMRSITAESRAHYSISEKELKERFVSGGFPCFASNLPIINVLDDQIKLKFNNGSLIDVVKDMKWSDDDSVKQHVSAFIKTTLLYVYAELFEEGHKPTTLNWSYPASMSIQDVGNKYNEIWKALNCSEETALTDVNNNAISPIRDVQGRMVPLKVRNFTGNMISADADDGFGDFWEKAGMADGQSEPQDTPADDPYAELLGNSDNKKSQSTPKGKKFEDYFEDIDPPFDSDGDQREISYADILKKEDPEAKLEFVPMRTSDPMTEAEAVANFSIKQKTGGDSLLLCFDVGGSTTDISALYTLDNDTMIKQSSVQFAAKRISEATSRFPDEFKVVLDDMCQKHNLRINGLNSGNLCYSAATAPYFFEQMVDTLLPSELPRFYNSIANNCPKLFAVDLYVTGLIMFYAGQLSRKIFDVLRFNDPNFDKKVKRQNGMRPSFQIQPIFEGKGGRIFEWLSVRNMEAAKAYFSDLFVEGFGLPKEYRNRVLSFLDLSKLQEESIRDVKMEVSGGLALGGRLFVPKPNTDLEIFGEENFEAEEAGVTYQYGFSDGLTRDKMELIGSRIKQYNLTCPCFIKFVSKFRNHATGLLGVRFNDEAMVNSLKNMQIGQYIRTKCPEFLKAAKKKEEQHVSFGFVSPIIIQEAIKFYDETLLKCFK